MPAPNMEQQDVQLSPNGFPEPASGRFSLSSRDPLLNVSGQLAGKPTGGTPRPKYTAHERPGDFDFLQYTGHEPFEQTIPIKFDGDRDSIENKIAQLERLARRTAKNDEPPVVKARGNGVLHPQYNWRVTAIDVDDGRTLYVPRTGERRLFVANVVLRQQVAEKLLAESISRSRKDGRGKGLRNRTITVLAGERTLYDVAKRYFRDPSVARELAVANGITLSARLKVGRKLRLP